MGLDPPQRRARGVSRAAGEPMPLTALNADDLPAPQAGYDPGSAIPERLLVVSAASGDAEAFATLVGNWIDRLFRVAYRILRDWDAADDATQDALVLAWRDIRGLRDPDRFEPWLYRLLVRVCYRRATERRRLSARVVDLTEVDVGGGDHSSLVADRDRIERALGRLTVEQRTVLVLYHYLGRSHAEIADVLQLPEGTVASRMHYATKALRAALAADDRPGSGQ
jgi:RNA polymerase sigma-70 factor, ECF subfamily